MTGAFNSDDTLIKHFTFNCTNANNEKKLQIKKYSTLYDEAKWKCLWSDLHQLSSRLIKWIKLTYLYLKQRKQTCFSTFFGRQRKLYKAPIPYFHNMGAWLTSKKGDFRFRVKWFSSDKSKKAVKKHHRLFSLFSNTPYSVV